MDATQILDDFDEEELINSETSKKTVAFLKVMPVGEFPETYFPVYEGENLVGRDKKCDIMIPLQVVSKKHACIDVHGKNHLICDYNSRNKTRRNQMFLKPQAFYELVNEVELMLADVKCQYLFAQTEDVVKKDISDSGSETASESMMPQSTEDDEPEEETREENMTGSPNNVKLEESMEKYFDQPTQDYSYKNPGENSPVFCAETDDDETDDERDNKDNTAPGITGSSFSAEQAVRYSPEAPGNDSTADATMPYSTLPNTLEPDTIPATPFTQTNDIGPPFKLKRSVDVKVDTSRRISAGNTLAYGLSTLESPNSTRESMDASESESAKEELSGGEVKNKLLFENTAGQETLNNSNERLSDSVPKQEEVLDDLLATQLYEPMEIPESPEFLKPDNDVNEPIAESTEITESAIPEDTIPEGEVSEYKTSMGKISDGKISEGKTSEGKITEGKTSEGKTSEGKITEGKTSEGLSEGNISEGEVSDGKISEGKISGKTSEVTMPNDDMLEETQAYGLGSSPEDTDYELAATQAYGDYVPKRMIQNSNVFKVPGAMNTQELNEDDDDQPTQKYLYIEKENDGAETSESSDFNLPSLSSFMGLKSDSDSDFMASNKDVQPAQTSTPAVTKSSIVIEGENVISTSRCYVECSAVEDETSQEKVHDKKRSSARKKAVGGRKKSTAQRGKVQEETMEDTTGLSTTPAKDDLATSSTTKDNIKPEDTDEQRETIVVKRGKGRATRGRKSAATTRGSRGKKDEVVQEGTEGNMEGDKAVESLPKGRKSTRKRKISEETAKTESKNEIGEDNKECLKSEKKEEKLHTSDDQEDNDMFRLQISAVDSPETDDFVPKKKVAREGKRAAQRGKKGLKGELESNNGLETTNVVGEKESKLEETFGVSRKAARKGRAKKKQEFDNNEDVVKQDKMDQSNNDRHRATEEKDSVVKSSKRGRAKKIQDVPEFDKNENITEVAVKTEELTDGNKDGSSQQKDALVKPSESVEQEVSDIVTADVNKRKSRTTGKKSKQTATTTSRNDSRSKVDQKLEDVQSNDANINEQAKNVDETEIKQPKTPAKRRAKKRKSSENSNENPQQRKGTAKKSRKNTSTDENTEMNVVEELSPPTRSLSSTASTSSTSSSNVSRSARKGKQQMKEYNEDSADQSSNVKIIFTGLQDNAFVKATKIVQALGGEIVEHLENCTHLVTDKVRRTVKLLCAVARGIPVVDMSWLDASKKSKSFVDSSVYILKDKEAQKKFNFCMERSLELSRGAGLLDGYKIHVTPHVRPPPEDMKEIIRSAKGEVITKMPTSRDNDVIVLACDEDKDLCQKAKIANAYHPELLLTGILKQELDLEHHKLTLNVTPDRRRRHNRTQH